MRRLPSIALCCLLASPAYMPCESTAATEEGFERYSVILNRKPFGDAPPEPAPAPAPVTPAESFAKNLRVCSIMEEDDTGEVKVGIVDTQSNKNFLLREGEMAEGIELLSASLEDEEAVLQKGSEIARINLGSGEITPMTPGQVAKKQAAVAPKPTSVASAGRTTYQDRRKARQDRRRLRREKELERKRKEEEKRALIEETHKKYTGEELRKQLQDYNLEAIRQGLPALPLELTQAQDDQLVAENILPPRDQEQAQRAATTPIPSDTFPAVEDDYLYEPQPDPELGNLTDEELLLLLE